MRTISEFTNHLKHCIQEEHGTGLSEKAVKDIKKTIEGAVKGAVQNQKAAEKRYYEQKYITEMLIDKIGMVLKQ
ncbi:hypothetical protein [Peribacillus sp. NPDC058075]|uniref:hypothetical protein n=1 Tax=unclassified Peribacillus TaxID=2675266 RepID=UPI0036DE6F34